MADIRDIITSVLFFIGLLISLLIPLPIKEEYRLFIISLIVMTFLYIELSKYNEKIEKQNEEINNLNKRFKTIEELNEIRLNIKELQKRVFKNG